MIPSRSGMSFFSIRLYGRTGAVLWVRWEMAVSRMGSRPEARSAGVWVTEMWGGRPNSVRFPCGS